MMVLLHSVICRYVYAFFIFFFTDPATSEIYTLSLHDALPIFPGDQGFIVRAHAAFDHAIYSDVRSAFAEPGQTRTIDLSLPIDRKSTRLNSSHTVISYAVFCLKKKKINKTDHNIIINKMK